MQEFKKYAIRLSRRLEMVASLVTPGNRVADVGCDHAYTAIYLAEHGISPNIIAMDVNQGPIDRAKDNIKKYGYSDIIETRKSNGLDKIEENEADTILIAGMGGPLMIQILTAKKEVMQSAKELVLQPQSEIHKVRYMLQEEGFLIIEESMVKEDEKYYFIMKAIKNSLNLDAKKYVLKEKEHFYYGKLLLEQKNNILKEFILWDYSLCEGIMESLNAEQTENSLARKQEIKERMDLLQRGLAYY
ncbi:MAG: hypothetical protein K0S04_1218 [Herbinix sp.]|jgi:tRNA (adenine22-N1)-methyltransferase|nr:hypothetical protein [Herbinix sp.]